MTRGYQNRRTTTEEGEVTVSGSGDAREYVTFQEKELEGEEGELNIEVNSGPRTLLRRSIFIKKPR
jgi:hypothetical protein